MATPDTSRSETDALASLEDRILRAVELMGQLRQENDSLKEQLESRNADRDAAAAHVVELRAENEQLNAELQNLRVERNEVRARIEKLLGQLDLLNT